MHKATLVLLAAVIAVALAEGQFYVPRAYYTIDAEGHESLPVPLRRLRRNIAPPSNYPWNQGGGSGAGAAAGACTCTCSCPQAGGSAGSGGAGAGAGAGAVAGGGFPGNYPLPGGNYGSSNPNAKRQ